MSKVFFFLINHKSCKSITEFVIPFQSRLCRFSTWNFPAGLSTHINKPYNFQETNHCNEYWPRHKWKKNEVAWQPKSRDTTSPWPITAECRIPHPQQPQKMCYRSHGCVLQALPQPVKSAWLFLFLHCWDKGTFWLWSRMSQRALSESCNFPPNYSRHGDSSVGLYCLEHCFSSFWNDSPS